ncbi:hypothetical protein [Lentzea fradiae]|uniref:hypothetical protein n=1 Tax=Lentzea fradiae TaxID=200378 RepID=UPI000B7FEE79|nr:hypothetical protein [Lentzea fradiae]
MPEGAPLPDRLRAWFALTSRWSAEVVAVSGPVDPSELVEEAGKLVFWVDGQGSWEWGVPLSGDDPPVFGREVGTDWAPVEESLSEFLLHVTVLESAIGSPHQCCAHGVPAARLNEMISDVPALPLPASPCPSMDARIFVGPDTLVQVSESVSDLTPSQERTFDVTVSAAGRTPIDEVVDGHPEIPWKRHTAFVPQGFSPDDLPGFLR